MRPSDIACHIPPLDRPAPVAGHGSIEIRAGEGRTYISKLRAQSPLKLLTPGRSHRAVSIIAGSYGGGLVAGDHLHLDLRVGPAAAVHVGTQASTKVYRSIGGRGCGQSLDLVAADDSVCVVAPDPVTPFEAAVYEQRQRFDLADRASLVLVDCLTAGRCARGERWAFARYVNRTDIFVGGRQVFRDHLLLDAADGPLNHPMRTGRLDCLATVVIIGPGVWSAATELLDRISDEPIGRGGSLVFAASPLPGGAVIRLGGAGSEIVVHWIRRQLAFVEQLLGENPWARKW